MPDPPHPTPVQLSIPGIPSPPPVARLTRAQRARRLLDHGVHPGSLRPLLDGDALAPSCGECSHVKAIDPGSGPVWRCGLPRSGSPRVARLSWPACTAFERAASWRGRRRAVRLPLEDS